MTPGLPVRTACPYCGVGCGIIATPDGAGSAAIAGDPAHPANFGRLCVKGSALGETLGIERRLLHPLIDGQRATWNQALGRAARGFLSAMREHGPQSVAFYLSGQLLTEDYYVANKLAKGFIGTPHVDTNSRLCMASSVAGHRRAFGSDTVPNSYADIDEADLIVLVGSNAAWCHPVLFQRMQAAREGRSARVVNIDPRRTATSEGADMHLAVAPGMDGVLWSWLFREIVRRGAVDQTYVADHVSGLGDALTAAARIAPDLETTCARTGLSERDVRDFVDAFITTERVVTCYSQGVNQSAQGTDKVNAILNCHLATGRIGKPGCGPLSLTGQPNAMGGREVGGLANMLAAHMGFAPSEVDRVRRFWGAPNIVTGEGLKAVRMFEAIDRGEIKALWVLHSNPAVSLPGADRVRASLAKLDHLVVSEASRDVDGLLAKAHVVLPAAPWGEKDGTVTNSERRISRQRAFLPAAGESKPDWWIVCEVARRMGFEEAFDFADAAAVFREHAALSAFENDGARDFDIGAMAGVGPAEFDALEPFQWPLRQGAAEGEARFFAEGGFYTADRRARMVAIADPALASATTLDRPLLLNTGRVRDHWHTMSRTALSPRLGRHIDEPYAEMHPDDARALGLDENDHAVVETDFARATLLVRLDAGARRGSVFAPIHWNDLSAGGGRVSALAQPIVDPISGQPESKATPVSLRKAEMRAHGLLVLPGRAALPGWLVHARRSLGGMEAIVLASRKPPAETFAALSNYLPALGARAVYQDAAAGRHRAVVQEGERLIAGLFVGPQRDTRLLDWVPEQFSVGKIDPDARIALLAGREIDQGADLGPVVCSCNGVRARAISEALAAGAASVDAVGAACKAGTTCGSCKPEISRMIRLQEHTSTETTDDQPDALPAAAQAA
jgi:assimilatory nitrate reductase catalytic subunit